MKKTLFFYFYMLNINIELNQDNHKFKTKIHLQIYYIIFLTNLQIIYFNISKEIQ